MGISCGLSRSETTTEAPVDEYDGRQHVGRDLHPRRSVIVRMNAGRTPDRRASAYRLWPARPGPISDPATPSSPTLQNTATHNGTALVPTALAWPDPSGMSCGCERGHADVSAFFAARLTVAEAFGWDPYPDLDIRVHPWFGFTPIAASRLLISAATCWASTSVCRCPPERVATGQPRLAASRRSQRYVSPKAR